MLKKVKIFNAFIILLFSFLFHFAYEWSPNSLFSIIFPVNESIWEHMKLIITPYVFYGIFEYIILKRKNINFNNFLLQLFIVPIIGVILYLIIYLPLYNIFGESMFLNISLLIIVIIIEQIISCYILNKEPIKYQEIIGVIGIIITYIVLGYLTYSPIYNYVFYDTTENKYGINIYQK